MRCLSKTMVLVSMFAALGLACADDAGSDSGGETAGDGDGDGSGDGDGDGSGDGDGDGSGDGVVATVVEADCDGGPIAGIRVFAQTADGTLIDQVTDVEGKAAFPDLVDGAAAVTAVLPGIGLASVVDVPGGGRPQFTGASDDPHVPVTGTASNKLDQAGGMLVFPSCGTWHKGAGADYNVIVPAGEPFELLAFEWTYEATERGFIQEHPRVFWGNHEAVSEATVFDFSFPEEGFPVSVSGSFSLAGLGPDSPLQPTGPSVEGYIYVYDRGGRMVVSGLAAWEVNQTLDAIDYTVEHVGPEHLDAPATGYLVFGPDGQLMQWVNEPGTPKAGTHSPDFLELPDFAGSDASVPSLMDGIEVAPYPDGVELALTLGLLSTSETWSIRTSSGATTLRVPTLPDDLDQAGLPGGATTLHGVLELRRDDGTVPGLYSAVSAKPVAVWWH